MQRFSTQTKTANTDAQYDAVAKHRLDSQTPKHGAVAGSENTARHRNPTTQLHHSESATGIQEPVIAH